MKRFTILMCIFCIGNTPGVPASALDLNGPYCEICPHDFLSPRLDSMINLYSSARYDEIIGLIAGYESLGWDEGMLLAKSYESVGLYDKANRLYRELYRKNRGLHHFGTYFTARNYERMKEHERAVKLYWRLLSEMRKEDSPTFEEQALITAALSRLYLLGFRVDSADRMLRRSRRFYEVARYYLFLGSLERGEYERAAEYAIGILASDADFLAAALLVELQKDGRIIDHMGRLGISPRVLFKRAMEEELYGEALDYSYLLDGAGDAELVRERAFCYMQIRDYEAAAALYEEHFMRTGDPASVLQRAYSFYYQRRFVEARRDLLRYRTAMSGSRYQTPIDDDAVFLALQLDLSTTGRGDAFQQVRRFLERNGSHTGSDALVIRAFYRGFSAGNREEAIEFLTAVEPFLESPYYRAWALFMRGLYRDPSLLEETTHLYPGSYYFFRARELMSNNGRGGGTTPVPPPGRYGMDELDASHFRRLLCLGLLSDMGEILLAGLPLSTPDERTGYHYFLSHLSYAMGQPAEGVRHAQYLLDGTKSYPTLSLPREVLVLLYPRVYMEEIEGFFSEGQKPYDRHLVLAIMREESRYNHLARSPRGALGLMQLMPATASWIVNRNLSEDDLYRPETNIETAVAYLDYLTDRFDGLEYVVASYNGGPNAVRRWMRNLGSRSVEQFVEEIPYVETRNFVKRVYTSYRMYMHLYGSPQSAGGSGNESML